MDENDHDLLIKVNTKLDAICEKLNDLPKLEERVRNLENTQGVHRQQISDNTEEINRLRTSSRNLDFLSWGLAVIGSILGIAVH
jgi:hypothetical protein